MPRSGEYSSDWSNDGGGSEGDLAQRLSLVQGIAVAALLTAGLDRVVADNPTSRSRVWRAVLRESGPADITAWGIVHKEPKKGIQSAVHFVGVQQKQANGDWSAPRELRVDIDGDARWMIPEERGEVIAQPAVLSEPEVGTLGRLVGALIAEHLR